MEPSARTLQQSIVERLAPYGDYLQILPAHGAGSACGKALGAVPTTTLGYERRFNRALRMALADRESFVREILSGQSEPPPYFATMKRVNRDGIAVTGGVPIPKPLDSDAFRRAAESARVVDARDLRQAFDEGHFPGSIHAPLHTPFFSAVTGSYLAENDSILLVLESAEDVDLAARQLYRIGLDGTIGWISAEDATRSGLFSAMVDRVEFEDFNPKDALSGGEIIDVRTSAEFERGRIEGARSFPYTRLAEHIAELPADKKLFIHCGSGKRAASAASFLRSHGFNAVHVDGVCEECDRIATAEGIAH